MGRSVHLNGRVYDPFTARFLSADSLIQDPGHSQSYNRYSYTWNNPTNFTDPSGFLAELTEAQQNLVNSIQGTLDAGGSVIFQGAVGDSMFAGIPAGTSSFGSLTVNSYTWQSAGIANVAGDASGSAQVTSASANGSAAGGSVRGTGGVASQGLPPPDYTIEVWGQRPKHEANGPSPADSAMLWWFAFNPFEQMARDAGASQRWATGIGFAATMVGNPKQLIVNSAEKLAVKAIAPVEKFSAYIFKEGADHGKDVVFRGLGYDASHSADLAALWADQAATKFANGEFTLGKLDAFGQRINIGIELPGIGEAAGKSSIMKSGWMILEDGVIKLNTPFSGFMK